MFSSLAELDTAAADHVSRFKYFLSHCSWENASDIQESLQNISANPYSPLEKYSSGVEDEDRKFSGKFRFFQREVSTSTTKYFYILLFLCWVRSSAGPLGDVSS